jgi:hypothetical protein
MSDWQVGDLAVCVDDSPCSNEHFRGAPFQVAKGTVLHVSGVGKTPRLGYVYLTFAEYPTTPHNRVGWCAKRWRKIRADEYESCEPEFVTLLKRSKTPEPVAVSIARANAMSAEFDRAAHALKRGDFTAFDEAMARFRKIQGGAR